MGAPDLLNVLHDMGLRLSAHGSELHVGPRTAITDDARRLIRDHKAELLATLRESADFGSAASRTKVEAMSSCEQPSDADQGEALPDLTAESRRVRVLAALDPRPDIRHHVAVDNPDTDPVRLMVGIRNLATFEVEVPKSRYDLKLLLDLIQKHGATIH